MVVRKIKRIRKSKNLRIIIKGAVKTKIKWIIGKIG